MTRQPTEEDIMTFYKMYQEQSQAINKLNKKVSDLTTIIRSYENQVHLENSEAVQRIIAEVINDSEDHKLRIRKSREICN